MSILPNLSPSFKFQPHRWQNQCKDAIINSEEDKLLISAITGSGKSLLQYAITNMFLSKHDHKISLMASESIALTQQFAVEYVEHNIHNAKVVCFNSSEIEAVDSFFNYVEESFGYDKDVYNKLDESTKQEITDEFDEYKNGSEEYLNKLAQNDIESFTSVEKINLIINECKLNNQPLLIVSTYHSLPKLRHINFETITLDEIHTSASSDRAEIVKALKSNLQLGFTATPVGKKNEKTGLYNETVFGKIIFEYKYEEAVNDGIITPITYTILNNSDFQGNELDKGKTLSAIYNYCAKVVETELYDYNHKIKKAIPKIVINVDNINQAEYVFDGFCNESEFKTFDFYVVTSKRIEYHNHQTKETEILQTKIEVLRHMKANKNMFVVLNIYMLNVGVDVPGFTALGCVSASKEVRLLQSIGRVIRVHSDDRGKKWNLNDEKSMIGITKPYGTFYLFNAGSKRDKNSKITNSAFKFLRSAFGSMLYFKEKGKLKSQYDVTDELETSDNILSCEEFSMNNDEKNIHLAAESNFEYSDFFDESYLQNMKF